MKIPESNANHGAYYTNEENGQWQGNGVIVDTGVGGGIVGSGDAGFQPALYPIPHETGYVMSGPGYYPAPGYATAPPDDFADYMWMENEEEFDKQVMQQLEEEALMEQCIEAMLEDERLERNRSRHGGRAASLEQAVSRSTLNPLAAEFVPSFTRSSTCIAQEKEKPPEPATASSKDDKPFEGVDSTDKTDCKLATHHEVTKKQESTPPISTTTTTVTQQQPEPPTTEEPSVPAIVSATATTTDGKTVVPVKQKGDAKRAGKGDVVAPTAKAKSKAHSAKSEPKVVASISKGSPATTPRREATLSRSEEYVSETPVAVTVVSATLDIKCEPTTTPVEEPAPSGVKPINYAAAAKANIPKKATPPPAVVAEKSQTSIHQTNSFKTSAPTKTAEIRSEKPTSRDRLATAPKSAKSTEKLRKNSSK